MIETVEGRNGINSGSHDDGQKQEVMSGKYIITDQSRSRS